MYCSIGSVGWDGQNREIIIGPLSASLDLIFVLCPKSLVIFPHPYREVRLSTILHLSLAASGTKARPTTSAQLPATARLQPCGIQGYVCEVTGRMTPVQPS